MSNAYHRLEFIQKKTTRKCLKIRNNFEKLFYNIRNRTHISFEELRDFVELAAKQDKTIEENLSYLIDNNRMYWRN